MADQPEPWRFASSGYIKAAYRGELRDAFGEWIEQLGSWKWFVTRTLGREADQGFTKVGRGMARRCLRDLLVRSRCERAVVVFELQQRGVLHLHALLETSQGINGGVEQKRDFNLWGIARWKAYKRDAGAPAYLGKYLTKDITELYIVLDGPLSESDIRGGRLDKWKA